VARRTRERLTRPTDAHESAQYLPIGRVSTSERGAGNLDVMAAPLGTARGQTRAASVALALASVLGGCSGAGRASPSSSTPARMNGSSTSTTVPRHALQDAHIAGWLRRGSCVPTMRRDHPKQCGVVSVDAGVRVTTDHALTVATGQTTTEPVTLVMSSSSRVLRYTGQPLATVITDQSGRALGGTIALGRTGLLPDAAITRSGPQQIEIAVVPFIGTRPIPPGTYRLWVVLVNDDVEPTTVAPALPLTVTA
jgi:hypothetical protein